MANLKLNNVVALSETGGVATFGSASATLKYPAGHVVNTTKYDLEDLAVVVSTTYANNKDTTFVQWGSLSYDVVLKQANSKILISTYFTIGNYAGYIYFDLKVSGPIQHRELEDDWNLWKTDKKGYYEKYGK